MHKRCTHDTTNSAKMVASKNICKDVPVWGRPFSWCCHMKLKKEPDVRTLCLRCRMNYEEAGYLLSLIIERYNEPCDICGRPGHNYIVSKPFSSPFRF